MSFISLGIATATTTPFILSPTQQTWLIITGHNSTASLNGMWLYRPGTGYMFHLSRETSTVTITGSASGQITVKTDGGTVNVYACPIG